MKLLIFSLLQPPVISFFLFPNIVLSTLYSYDTQTELHHSGVTSNLNWHFRFKRLSVSLHVLLACSPACSW